MRIDDVQRRRGSLVQLVLDGEPAALIDRKTFEESPYEVGSSLSEEQWVALKKESKTRRAWDKALYLLSLRDYARAQLQRKLEREAGSELARETVERLKRAGLLNDGAYARRLARDMVERRHFSRRRTLQELTARGLDRETAEEAVEELEPDDAEQALELLRKKRYNELSDPDTRPLWHGRALAGMPSAAPWNGAGKSWRRMKQRTGRKSSRIPIPGPKTCPFGKTRNKRERYVIL